MSNTKKATKIISAQFDAWTYGPKFGPTEKKAAELYLIETAKIVEPVLADESIRLEAFKIECIKTRVQELEAELKELKAQLPVEPKVSSYKKPMNLGVGALVVDLINQGLGNKDVLAKVEEHYGNKNTTYACVAWYRNKLNQQ